jgi:hypothetical protein
MCDSWGLMACKPNQACPGYFSNTNTLISSLLISMVQQQKLNLIHGLKLE